MMIDVDLDIKNLSFSSEDTGYFFAKSKSEYIWKFNLDKVSRKILLEHSRIKGKRVIYLDDKEICKFMKYTYNFTYSFSIDKHIIQINQDGDNYLLKIDGVSFKKLENQQKLERYNIIREEYIKEHPITLTKPVEQLVKEKEDAKKRTRIEQEDVLRRYREQFEMNNNINNQFEQGGNKTVIDRNRENINLIGENNEEESEEKSENDDDDVNENKYDKKENEEEEEEDEKEEDNNNDTNKFNSQSERVINNNKNQIDLLGEEFYNSKLSERQGENNNNIFNSSNFDSTSKSTKENNNNNNINNNNNLLDLSIINEQKESINDNNQENTKRNENPVGLNIEENLNIDALKNLNFNPF